MFGGVAIAKQNEILTKDAWLTSTSLQGLWEVISLERLNEFCQNNTYKVDQKNDTLFI